MIICLDADGRVALKDSVTRRSAQHFEPFAIQGGTGDPPAYACSQRRVVVCLSVRTRLALLTPSRHTAPKVDASGLRF